MENLNDMRIIQLRYWLIVYFCIVSFFTGFSQQTKISSPNQKILIELLRHENKSEGNWYLKVFYNKSGNAEMLSEINLGLVRNDQEFTNNLKVIRINKSTGIVENYSMLLGKKTQCSNAANEIIINFENSSTQKMNLILRAYNDGIAFRYEFPGNGGKYIVKDELTSYTIPSSYKRWIEKFDLSNEWLYKSYKNDSIQANWAYPALFNSSDSACWFLIHEADVNRSYCASRLGNKTDKQAYKITFPEGWEGNGDSLPTISLPWKSPWRVVMIGSLADIVESTLITDVSPPSVISETGWIKPGIASWNYWSNNHGTRDYKVVCEYTDLAVEMGWPYTLLDWEWDQMSNGGNLEDAVNYIHSKGVKPLIWYNSGAFKWITATPVDRMMTHEKRIEEFAKLKKLGIAGVKVDFFLNEKQEMMNYYLDILDDAAKYNIMVYFHGCIVPRGWHRTYPHLMTFEGVRGAEWYNNGPEFTTTAPEHNSIMPFTRNVVGSMDYTPVTFTNSQYPHITSYGHELALSVVFESGIQHMADRPSGYHDLPDAAKTFLREVPNAWDNTKLLDGYPGCDIIIARQKGNQWFLGGINAENIEKNKTIQFDFLPAGVKYKLTCIADGEHDKELKTQYTLVDNFSTFNLRMLRRGGFVMSLIPVE